ncbi:MAG: hypothetical protein RBT74_04185 [Tenuifilaceae bacterium]|nr:hypothetical protein [Tenuifilaceae bacterium]
MLIGPDYLYKCPRCGRTVKKGSLSSGNTFGATFYSDGRFFAPMYQQYPEITKCLSCGEIFWLDDGALVGMAYPYEPETPEWENAPSAEYLSLDDNFVAIDNKIFRSAEEEIYLRVRIWWAYNDRVRRKARRFTGKDDKQRWESNCNALIDLLNPHNIDHTLMLVELHRNLGRFTEALQIAETIPSDNYPAFKAQQLLHCRLRRKRVFRIKE